MYAIFWVLWGKQNVRVFRHVDRESSEVLSFVRFHVSFLASILNTFCTYIVGLNLHSWISFFVDCFFLCPCVLSFFHDGSCFHLKKF